MAKYKWKLRPGKRNMSKKLTDNYIPDITTKTNRDCPTGKVAYGSIKIARKVHKEMVSKKNAMTLQIYICNACRMFHIGNKMENDETTGEPS